MWVYETLYQVSKEKQDDILRLLPITTLAAEGGRSYSKGFKYRLIATPKVLTAGICISREGCLCYALLKPLLLITPLGDCRTCSQHRGQKCQMQIALVNSVVACADASLPVGTSVGLHDVAAPAFRMEGTEIPTDFHRSSEKPHVRLSLTKLSVIRLLH